MRSRPRGALRTSSPKRARWRCARCKAAISCGSCTTRVRCGRRSSRASGRPRGPWPTWISRTAPSRISTPTAPSPSPPAERLVSSPSPRRRRSSPPTISARPSTWSRRTRQALRPGRCRRPWRPVRCASIRATTTSAPARSALLARRVRTRRCTPKAGCGMAPETLRTGRSGNIGIPAMGGPRSPRSAAGARLPPLRLCSTTAGSSFPLRSPLRARPGGPNRLSAPFAAGRPGWRSSASAWSTRATAISSSRSLAPMTTSRGRTARISPRKRRSSSRSPATGST